MDERTRAERRAVTWILWSIVGAGGLHLLEEYTWPGGFMKAVPAAAPRFAPFVTPAAAVAINGLMITGLVVCALVGTSVPFLSLSGATLVFLNGLVHLGAALRAGGYIPGVVSGVLLYIPLAVIAYVLFARSGYLSPRNIGASVGLGLLYQLAPLAYFSVRAWASGGEGRRPPPNRSR